MKELRILFNTFSRYKLQHRTSLLFTNEQQNNINSNNNFYCDRKVMTMISKKKEQQTLFGIIKRLGKLSKV